MNLDVVKNEVYNLLANDKTGHGIQHIKNVVKYSKDFLRFNDADYNITMLIAYLHDVDDYKLFNSSSELSNAKIIMEKANIDLKTQEKVLENIKKIGFHNALIGVRPLDIEGKIVSDADMCDAMGVHGILRAYQYSLSKNQNFFDKDIFPIVNIDFKTYIQEKQSTTVCHIFEKLLKLKDFMLTKEGKKTSMILHKNMINFLISYFQEVGAEEWIKYLKDK